MKMRATVGIGVFLASLALCGCAPQRPKSMVDMETLVAEYNENAAAVPRLWARAKIEITLTDEKGRSFSWGSASPLAPPNGLLLLGKTEEPNQPCDFVLTGREAGKTLFAVGSNVTEGVYYLWYSYGREGGLWWGRNQFAGAAGVKDIPIDPHQLLAVLAINSLPRDFTALPTVAMTMDDQPFAYVLTYIDRQPVSNRIKFRREVLFTWDDKKPRLCFMVNFFDDSGMRIMTARLDNYQPIAATGGDGKKALMPADIEIGWPEKKSRIRIALSEMTAAKKGNPAAASSLQNNLPKEIPPQRVVQVDKNIK